jgi:hypothetical protein
MNRQVGPSIVLSVSIVCFFAVALFQRDAPRSGRARSGPGDTKLSPPRTASVTEDVQVKRPTELPEPPQPLKDRDARRDERANRDPGSQNASIAHFPPAPARARGAKEAAPIVTAGFKSADSVDLVRQPDSAFTVVRENETIRDVAVRVYGSNEHVGTLWRANRDALPLLNSPLSSGIVLRTPSVR